MQKGNGYFLESSSIAARRTHGRSGCASFGVLHPLIQEGLRPSFANMEQQANRAHRPTKEKKKFDGMYAGDSSDLCG